MKNIFLILTIAGIFFVSCQKDTLPKNFDFEQEENFRWGNEYFSNDNSIKLTITEINDSRCPSDVVCIWQGEAIVKLKVEADITNIIELSTFDNQTDTVGSYSISLINVSPYPVSTENIELDNYVVALSIVELLD